MSPRRRLEPSEGGSEATRGMFSEDPSIDKPATKQPRRRGLPTLAAVAALVIAAAITVSTLLLVAHESHRRAAVKDVDVIGAVRSFMTEYTTLDPFRANDYTDRVLADATDDFAAKYQERVNEIAIQVARAEPTTGTVLDAGVERWNDDGSANVVVATKTTTRSPDGKTVIESGNRWVITAIKKGDQWKISGLLQVI